MFPKYGTVNRSKPVLQVLRGWNPNEPTTNSVAYRVQSGVTIKSGQVISAVKNDADDVYEWVLGLHADATIPYFAHQDSDQTDVVSANSLVGLSCLGVLVLRTGYYVAGETYTVDTPLTAASGGNAGSLIPTTENSGAPILGYVREGIENLLAGGPTGYPSISAVDSGNVITLQTAWVPNPEVGS